MGDLHLFLSKAAQANVARCELLNDAVLNLASVIAEIGSSPAEQAEWADEADWLLKEMLRDGDSKTGARDGRR